MVDLIALFHTVLIAAGREEQKGGTIEYMKALQKEEEARNATISAYLAKSAKDCQTTENR